MAKQTAQRPNYISKRPITSVQTPAEAGAPVGTAEEPAGTGAPPIESVEDFFGTAEEGDNASAGPPTAAEGVQQVPPQAPSAAPPAAPPATPPLMEVKDVIVKFKAGVHHIYLGTKPESPGREIVISGKDIIPRHAAIGQKTDGSYSMLVFGKTIVRGAVVEVGTTVPIQNTEVVQLGGSRFRIVIQPPKHTELDALTANVEAAQRRKREEDELEEIGEKYAADAARVVAQIKAANAADAAEAAEAARTRAVAAAQRTPPPPPPRRIQPSDAAPVSVVWRDMADSFVPPAALPPPAATVNPSTTTSANLGGNMSEEHASPDEGQGRDLRINPPQEAPAGIRRRKKPDARVIVALFLVIVALALGFASLDYRRDAKGLSAQVEVEKKAKTEAEKELAAANEAKTKAEKKFDDLKAAATALQSDLTAARATTDKAESALMTEWAKKYEACVPVGEVSVVFFKGKTGQEPGAYKPKEDKDTKVGDPSVNCEKDGGGSLATPNADGTYNVVTCQLCWPVKAKAGAGS